MTGGLPSAPISLWHTDRGGEHSFPPRLLLNDDDSRRGVSHGAGVSDRPRMKDSDMALYEHVFLARQDLAQAQVDALAEIATKIVNDNEGRVIKTESWGLRSLAYKIAKNRKAHYVMLEIDAPGNVIAELERQTQINEDIIRYMTVKIDAAEEGPSVMMRKSDRDRERRGDREGGREGRGDRPDRGDREDRPRRSFDGE
jgi:small subunit ribosomal protein S6